MQQENTANTTGDNARDLPVANPNQQYKGQEGENHSTAAEGTLKTADELPQNFGTGFEPAEEHDLDDAVHSQGAADDDIDDAGQVTPLNKEQKFTPDDITS
jgi:hypothetical protein